MKKTGVILFTILCCAAIAAGLYFTVGKKIVSTNSSGTTTQSPSEENAGRNITITGNPNFITAARAATPVVVHIKTTYDNVAQQGNIYEDVYGPPAANRVMKGSGSGVVISPDGYIATNNHVVENATGIEVVFPDRKEFTAELVGSDPNTDLALLKIKASGLAAIKLGNSDRVEVGEWVLAVGYPFSLNTTVTAGIISAKGRSIGIINSSEGAAQQSPSAIESFIQTDAAINPGNSGGALVNTSGELIGINTAIASLTGSYAGYAFAIPVNLAKKILDDIKDFGKVKRGILGVAFPSPSAENLYMKQQGITPGSVNGVFITDIQNGSAADAAGLKEGDIIQSINGLKLYASSEFSEQIARHRPGDKISLTYLRNGKVQSTSATLKGEEVAIARNENPESLKEIYTKLGAGFAPITPALKQRFNLKSGVVVTEIISGGFFEQLGIPPGTIIAYINGRAMNTPADIENALMAARNTRVQILAVAPDGSKVAFNFSFGA